MRHLLALAGLAVLLAAPAQAQFIDGLAPHPEAEEAPPAEGIQVHGKWTITVREPDGALTEERVFQNAITLRGAAFLSDFLAGEFEPIQIVGWEVFAVWAGLGNDDPCIDDDGDPTGCVITSEEPGPNDPNELFTGLTFGPIVESNAVVGTFLSGRFTAQRDGRVSDVATRLLFDRASGNRGATGFSSKDLDEVISVAEGQTVDVRVEFSFE